MSETIQSISQGTYTIGETSATNFIAGPGITIDQPSAGTVRIGNDETVLFETTARTSAATLSEPFSAFESIKIVHNTQVEEVHNPVITDALRYWHFYGTPSQGVYKIAMVNCSLPDYTHITNVSSRTLFYPVTGTATAYTVSLNDTYALNTIVKVIGINRISGGNA